MSYQSAAAFRRALEQRLLAYSRQQGLPLLRLRKTIAFERFLARLVQAQPDAWLLKGGFALQLRLGLPARTTLDLDLLLLAPTGQLHHYLVQAAKTRLGDWFEFSLRPSGVAPPDRQEGGTRFSVTSLLDGRVFETFHLDIGIGDPVVGAAETLVTSPLLDFAGIGAIAVPCYPLTQHLAEKLHAYVRPRPGGSNTRVKDLVDLLLVAQSSPISAAGLAAALSATFAARGEATPPELPPPPPTWARPFAELAREVGLEWRSLADGFAAASRFLDPVLKGEADGTWEPGRQCWQPAASA